MELKNRPAPGPYSVDVVFQDGSKMTVLKDVDGFPAVDKYNEYIRGIGARVGTTRRVCVMMGEQTVACWVYGNRVL